MFLALAFMPKKEPVEGPPPEEEEELEEGEEEFEDEEEESAEEAPVECNPWSIILLSRFRRVE